MSGYMQYEVALFLQSAALGTALLWSYDVLRILRRLFVHSSFAVALEDVLFWIFAGLFVFARIYQTNQGALRAFLFLGMGLGMTLYHILLEDLFVEGGSRILKIPVNFVKKTRNRLLFWIKRCRIYLSDCVSRRKLCKDGRKQKRLRGGKVEKVKKEIWKH